MCGRVNVSDHEGLQALLAMMGMALSPVSPPRFNIAPAASLDVVTLDKSRSGFSLESMRWGFATSRSNRLLFNARSESVFSKPSFRYSAQSQRAIVPINGFYEWQSLSTGAKNAFHVSSADGGAIALAGIYQAYTPAATTPLTTQPGSRQLSLGLGDDQEDDMRENPETTKGTKHKDTPTSADTKPLKHEVCVLTVNANQQMRAIHDRMPVIVGTVQAQNWLLNGDEALLTSCCDNTQHLKLQITHVDSYVNNASNDDSRCLNIATD